MFPYSEYTYHFIATVNQNAQESINLARKEEGSIKVEREEPRSLVDARRQVTLMQFHLGTSPLSCPTGCNRTAEVSGIGLLRWSF